MSITIRIIVDVLLVLGAFFSLAGVVGVLRMPDAYCRMQSSTNIATLGILNLIIAALIYATAAGMGAGTAIKIALVGLFTILTNPIASHAICKAAYISGVRPKKDMICDEYGEDFDND